MQSQRGPPRLDFWLNSGPTVKKVQGRFIAFEKFRNRGALAFVVPVRGFQSLVLVPDGEVNSSKVARPTMISLFKLKAILTMSAVFALGAVIGASWGGILVSRNAASAHLSPHKNKPGMVEKYHVRLKLSPEQTQRLESILDETQHEFRQLHLAVKPQFEEIRQKMRSSIRHMLNEEQKREYEVMIREREEQKAKKQKDRAH